MLRERERERERRERERDRERQRETETERETERQRERERAKSTMKIKRRFASTTHRRKKPIVNTLECTHLHVHLSFLFLYDFCGIVPFWFFHSLLLPTWPLLGKTKSIFLPGSSKSSQSQEWPSSWRSWTFIAFLAVIRHSINGTARFLFLIFKFWLWSNNGHVPLMILKTFVYKLITVGSSRHFLSRFLPMQYIRGTHQDRRWNFRETRRLCHRSEEGHGTSLRSFCPTDQHYFLALVGS